MPQLGPLEIAVVLLVALLVFGPTRLPDMARQVGGALRELRRIQHDVRRDLHGMLADESDGATAPPSLPPKPDPVPGDVIDVTDIREGPAHTEPPPGAAPDPD